MKPFVTDNLSGLTETTGVAPPSASPRWETNLAHLLTKVASTTAATDGFRKADSFTLSRHGTAKVRATLTLFTKKLAAAARFSTNGRMIRTPILK